MSAHTAYYQVPPYTHHVAIPQGWRPPFQGPPPMPSGMNVNPQLWQAGRWQPNPAYFAQHQGRPSQPHQQSWVASQAWQQPRAQESKNPYKRVPKPPSEEYLKSALSDNPLGLTDMIPAEQLYAQKQAHETANGTDERRPTSAESPWIWNPPSLAPDEDDQSDVSSNVTSHDPTQPRTPSRPLNGPVKHDAPPRRSSSQAPEQPREAPFTGRQELVPTFSINIVRTPEHYKSSPSRSSSRSSMNRASAASIDSQQLATSMESLTTTDFPSAPVRQSSMPDVIRPSSSQEFYQPSSLSGVSDLVEEPTNTLLSPLLLTTPKPSSRGIGRYSTFPFINGPPSLDTIPETSMQLTSDQQYNGSIRNSRNPTRVKTDPVDAYHHHHHHQQQHPHHQHHHNSPNHPPASNTSPYFNPSPSHSSQSPNSSRASSQHPSPTSLPQSPHEYQTTPPTSGSSKHSNPMLSPSIEQSNAPLSTSMSSSKKRVRKGYWNKRGDHLTMSGYIVYAPQDQAFPQELHDYPDPVAGYRDEKGQVVNFLQRPEHPESRSRHGQQPPRPYYSFIEYV